MSAHRYLLIALICLLAGVASAQNDLPPEFQPAPRPLPSSTQRNAGVSLELYFTSLEQGGSGLLRLSGADLTSARYTFLGEQRPFFSRGDGWYALMTVAMNAQARRHELMVVAWRDAEQIQFRRQVPVEPAGFILQEFDLPAERAHLVDAEVETAELELLASLTADASAVPLWDESGFELPLDSPLTSPFGSFRLLNGARQTRHTGWDQLAPVGTPIRTLAAGRVVLADRLEIRGNYVLIDHGLGIYSGYAHFSEVLVQTGQTVAAGQIIGSSGDTGRSSGPHLHWEIVANGDWVDGRLWLDLWLPA